MELPNIMFGKASYSYVDWKHNDVNDIDDEVLSKTPNDVIELLGFDPLTIASEDKDAV
jgi:hypothetical protein